MRDFAEQEIVIPDEAGQPHFRISTQPFSAHWFAAIDSGRFERHWLTGCVQSGKTLCGVLIPAMYHLFEIGESVIVGLPTMEMAGDKWREDFAPTIKASRYRSLLPAAGGGSRGGEVRAIKFRNGATLRFMSGGGGDEKRSGYTARVVVLTEVDKFDAAGGSSRETDKISQIIARTDRFASRRRIYGECTVSIREGRIWQEYIKGTMGTLVMQCHTCGNWVTPEARHFVGWQEAATVIEAGERARFACPACGVEWTDAQREKADRNARLIFRTDETVVDAGGIERPVMQRIDAEGNVIGQIARTDSFSFRWNAANNLFWPASEIGKRMWRAERREDQEEAEREIDQFVWCVPHDPGVVEMTPLVASVLEKRALSYRRGIIPDGHLGTTVGVDLGKRLAHWLALSFYKTAEGQVRGHVADYGRFEIASDDLGPDKATRVALQEFEDNIAAGWITTAGVTVPPSLMLIDSGWPDSQGAVYAFCRDKGNQRHYPIKGFGATQKTAYMHPKAKSKTVRRIGDNWFIAYQGGERIKLIHINADHWKSVAQNRLGGAQDAAGAITLFQSPDAREHLTLVKHFTAEKQVEEFKVGKGMVLRWEVIKNRPNHWLDCLYIACAGGDMLGMKVAAGTVSPATSLPAGRRSTAESGWFKNRRKGAQHADNL